MTRDKGIELCCQSKFEMLQSSLYPESYGVPSEHFFIIKFYFTAMADLKEAVNLKRIQLFVR